MNLEPLFSRACKVRLPECSVVFLTGVFSDSENEEMEDLMLSPFEQLEKSLQSMSDSVLMTSEQTSSADVTSSTSYRPHVAIVAEKLELILLSESSKQTTLNTEEQLRGFDFKNFTLSDNANKVF